MRLPRILGLAVLLVPPTSATAQVAGDAAGRVTGYRQFGNLSPRVR